jgi:hypothetical protein
MGREVNSSDAERSAFGAALYSASSGAGFAKVSQLGAALREAGFEITDTQVKRWIDGASEPQRPLVTALEQLCDLNPGTLSRHLGWLPLNVGKVSSIEEAIAADKSLGARERRVVLDLVRGLRKPK